MQESRLARAACCQQADRQRVSSHAQHSNVSNHRSLRRSHTCLWNVQWQQHCGIGLCSSGNRCSLELSSPSAATCCCWMTSADGRLRRISSCCGRTYVYCCWSPSGWCAAAAITIGQLPAAMLMAAAAVQQQQQRCRAAAHRIQQRLWHVDFVQSCRSSCSESGTE